MNILINQYKPIDIDIFVLLFLYSLNAKPTLPSSTNSFSTSTNKPLLSPKTKPKLLHLRNLIKLIPNLSQSLQKRINPSPIHLD